MPKITAQTIIDRKKKDHRKITVLTAYDFPTAKIIDEAGIDIILVGDSLGMVMLGHESTVPVTVDDMLHHLRAVARAVKNSFLVVDMPYGSYKTVELTLRNAKTFMTEGKAEAVKLEGGFKILDQVKALCDAHVPVMGHLGMLPQSVQETGGYKVQGKTKEEADQMMEEAKALEKAGVFSIVLECVPEALGKRITEGLKIPTIGIGAGPHTDGQVLVLHDMLGYQSSVKPRFVRAYADLDSQIKTAVSRYKDDVLKAAFPSKEESF